MTGRGAAAASLATLCFGRFCMGLQLQAVAAIGPFLMADLGFSYGDIGLLIGLFLAPGIVLGMPGALLGARFGYRRVGLLGVALMAVGGLGLALMQDLWTAAAARLVAGTGGILVNITFLRLVTETFEGRAMNRAIAIVMSSWPVGLALATVSFPYLAMAADWRLPLYVLTGVTTLAALCAYAFLPRQRRAAETRRALWSLDLDRNSRTLSFLAGCSFAMFTAGGVVFLSFVPAFLVERGYGLTEASGIASLIVWLGLVGTPLGGWLADRHSQLTVILAGTVGSALLVALVALSVAPWPTVFLLGIIWGLPAAPFTGLLQRSLPPGALGVGYGIYFTLFYTGFFALPALAGALTDRLAASETPLWFAVVLFLLTVASLAAFARCRRAAEPLT